MEKKLIALIVLCFLAGGCAGPLRYGASPKETGDEDQTQKAMKYFAEAKVAEAQKNHNAAIVALRSAADIDPTSPTIYARLAHNYAEIHDYYMAIIFAHRALELDPERLGIRHLLLQIAYRESDRDGAVQQLEALIQRDPLAWKLYFQLARLYMEMGQSARITPLFESALDHPEAPVGLKVDIADIFARSGQRTKARAIYEEVLATHPVNEDAWVGRAELEHMEGNKAAAINYYHQAGQLLPQSAIIFHNLARLLESGAELDEILAGEDMGFLYQLGLALSEAGKYEEATAVFERIVGLRPTTTEGWVDLARYYFYLDNHERAYQIFAQAAESMPDSVDIYLYWGSALEEQERFDEAIDVYLKGMTGAPDEAELYLYLGLILERQGALEQAIANYRKGLEVGAAKSPLYTRWGVALGRQDKWQEALIQYRRAVDLEAENVEALLHWGIALTRLERWEEAAERLRRTVKLAVDDTHSWFYLASCYEQAARTTGEERYFENAIEAFKSLLEIDPDDAYALNYLGYMYADKGIKLEEAVGLLQRAIGLEPTNGAFLDSLGWAYFRLGQLESAERYIDQALQALDEEEAEEKAVIFDHAGDVARDMGNKEEAQQHWQRALELDPDNEKIQRKLDAPPWDLR